MANIPTRVPIVFKLPLTMRMSSASEPCQSCLARFDCVCAGLAEGNLAYLAAIASTSVIEKGTSFIAEGEPADDFYNIISGTAKLYKSLSDGRMQITGFAQRGDFLGLAASARFAFTAESLDRMQVCRISRRRFKSLTNRFPALEERLLERASHELVAAQEQFLLLGRKTARERLATFLLAQATRAYPETNHRTMGPISLAMTRKDIADYLGLTIETISRQLTRLKRDRLIATSGLSEFTILDPLSLSKIAGGLLEEDMMRSNFRSS